ncbi:MAG TPA: hypothetical protein VGO03_00425 [Acidimicrobiia bacterium]
MTRRALVGARLAALVTAAMLAVAACSGGSSSAARGHGSGTPHATGTTERGPAHSRTVAVSPVVLTSGSHAAVTRVVVGMSPAAPSQSAVAVSGSTTANTQWSAAAWDAVMAATLRMGAQCDGHRFTFRVSGPLDATSASALLTVAVLALLRGDSVQPHVSVAGTIDPDGALGLVDDVAARAVAARAGGITTLLVPPGEGAPATSTAPARTPVASLDDAYRAVTGRALPALGAAAPALPTVPSSLALVATIHTNAAAAQSNLAKVAALPAAVRDGLASITGGARADLDRATALTRAGSSAGAFQLTREASTTAGAADAAGTLVANALPQGVNTFAAQVQSDLTAGQTARNAQFAKLDLVQPRTLADVSALLAAYGAATDSAELAGYAAALHAQFVALPASTSRAELVQLALGTAFFTELARGLVDYSADIIAAAATNAGGAAPSSAPVRGVAACFDAAAAANLVVFDEVVVQQHASSAAAVSQARATLAAKDLDYVLATATAPSDAAPYAQLGADVARFVRSVNLLDQYAGMHVQRNASGVVTAVSNGEALASAMSVSTTQVGEALATLANAHVAPVIELGMAAIAAADGAATVDRRVTALGEYESAFVTSRVLVELGAH